MSESGVSRLKDGIELLRLFTKPRGSESLLVEVDFNFPDEVSSIPVASACAYLNVFGVNTQSVHYFN